MKKILIAVFAVLISLPSWGATITVTNNNETGAGSLAEAINNANAGDVIEFDANVGTINLTGGLPQITQDNLTINGQSHPNWTCEPVIKIEGPGITIETSPFYNPPPLTLEPGSRQSFSGAQLYELLMAENLDFKGLSRSEFERGGGALPEGFYRFSITVRDYRRPDVILSNQATAMVWLTLGDPPLLNQPHCGTEIKLNEGMQNLIFQWTPLNAGSPYALTTEYIFTLVEIRVPGFNPNDAINSLPPIYEVTTNQTSILYGPAEPPLIPGMEYVWRVQAVDMQGRDVFKNNGYSNICAFRITEDVSLLSPSDLTAEAESDRRARVTWSLMPEVESYRIEYRKADMEEAAWFGQDSEEDELIISNLEPETTYEVRAGSKRGNYTSSWGESVTFTTDAAREFICGQDPSLGEIENKNPLKSAMTGDIFKVGHFEMTVQTSVGVEPFEAPAVCWHPVQRGTPRITCPGGGTGRRAAFRML